MSSLFLQGNSYLECQLCPHYCKIKPGKTGICGVRKNTGQKIELLTYGVISGYSLDPVEKKPLYHFFPGHNILSIGSYGCNLKCDFCQNNNISQKIPKSLIPEITPEQIIETALSASMNIGVAFTYNEPVIWFEFMRDTAIEAKKRGLFTAMISNGYLNRAPLEEIITFTDAFNIDLKAFEDSFYKSLTGANIEPVKKSLTQIAKSGKHLEITTLIIPGHNDNKREMASESEWIAGELGKDVPLHISRYFPMYRRNDQSTPEDTLKRLFETASKNLNYVYMGNTTSDTGHNTLCPQCGLTLTIRSGYQTTLKNTDLNGNCKGCGLSVYKYLTFSSPIMN